MLLEELIVIDPIEIPPIEVPLLYTLALAMVAGLLAVP